MRPSTSVLVALALCASAVPAWGHARCARHSESPQEFEVLVFDGGGEEPVSGLTAGDFLVRESDAASAPRRFVFVFNRRGADASQLNRALRGLRSFIEERTLDSDRFLFADLGETLRVGRAFAPGRGVARAGLGTISPMGYRSPAGAADDAAVVARMLEVVADRLDAIPGRKIVALFSGSLSSFSETAEQPGVFRTPDVPGIRSGVRGRGEKDAGLASITGRLVATGAEVHVLHLAGVQEHETRILFAERQEFDPRQPFSSTSYEGRFRDVSPRSGDDILSNLAARTGGRYFTRATDFHAALDRVESRNRSWYLLTLEGSGQPARQSVGISRSPGAGMSRLPGVGPAPLTGEGRITGSRFPVVGSGGSQ